MTQFFYGSFTEYLLTIVFSIIEQHHKEVHVFISTRLRAGRRINGRIIELAESCFTHAERIEQLLLDQHVKFFLGDDLKNSSCYAQSSLTIKELSARIAFDFPLGK